ncbi:alpha/beta fold hydrolase [Pyruvatibacter sp.]|uniref:alpha/beta hydrolase n=1 Tax=Pyruvatibacter sp. TaxID=1981328 RepID=UPI0032EFA80E
MWKYLVGGAVGVLVVVLGILYVSADRESMLAAEFRDGSGYLTVPLEGGVTAYKDMGPKDAVPLVIVHGATLGSIAYEAYYAPLLAQGYRVISYDQFGRGFSDRPEAPFTIDMMRTQLLGLLDHLEIERAALYGVSFGGAVIARFAAAHPERVRALGFQVPLISVESTGLGAMLGVPVANRFFSRVIVVPAIIERGESFGTDTDEQRRVVTHFKQQFEVEGTERMMRQMFVGDAMSSRLEDHAAIAAADIPTQFVYATDDPEILAETVEEAIALYDTPDVHTYTGGHFFSATRQDELAAKLAAFFKANGA